MTLAGGGIVIVRCHTRPNRMIQARIVPFLSICPIPGSGRVDPSEDDARPALSCDLRGRAACERVPRPQRCTMNQYGEPSTGLPRVKRRRFLALLGGIPAVGSLGAPAARALAREDAPMAA